MSDSKLPDAQSGYEKGYTNALAGVAGYDGYTKVLSTTLKNSGTPKDLVIGLSFETSLFTMTMVQSKGGKKSHAVADAEIEMYVTVDGVPLTPTSNTGPAGT